MHTSEGQSPDHSFQPFTHEQPIPEAESFYTETPEQQKTQELPEKIQGVFSEFIKHKVTFLTRTMQGLESQVYGRKMSTLSEIQAGLLPHFQAVLNEFTEGAPNKEDEASVNAKAIELVNKLLETFSRIQLIIATATESAIQVQDKLRSISKDLKLDEDIQLALFRPLMFQARLEDEMQRNTPEALEKLKLASAQHDHITPTPHVTSHGIEILIKDLEERGAFSEEDYEAVRALQGAGEAQAQKLKQQAETNAKKYAPAIRELRELLKFQNQFEKQVNLLILNPETGELPKDIFSNLERDAENYTPELATSEHQAFFPVGITKDLPKKQQEFKGDLKSAKPVEIYAYLFWLNNQNQKITLMVADTAQVPNYMGLYDLSEQEAKTASAQIGEREASKYQKIIDTFGLQNIEIVRYQDFLKDKQDFKANQELVEKLLSHPLFKKAREAMLPASLKGNGAESFSKYGAEELAVILSTPGRKISHQNEARYDALASVIQNVEKEYGKTVFADPNSTEFIEAYDAVLGALQLKLKAESEKPSLTEEQKNYFAKAVAGLSLLRESEKDFLKSHIQDSKERARVLQRNKVYENLSSKVEYNFSVPSVATRSFGWKTGKKGETVSTVSGTDPYADFFYQGEFSFLHANQVVATTEGYIGGKVLALDQASQTKYAEESTKPLLTHFVRTLQNTPPEYFKSLGKNKEDLIAEAKEIRSVAEATFFIQKYIVRPTQEI